MPSLRALAASGSVWRTRGAGALIVLSAVVSCWPTLHADYLGDDFGYVRLFHDKPLASFFRLGDISEGIWGRPLDELRPAFALSFKLGLLVHGADPRGFHLTNILLHALCAALVWALLRTAAPAARAAALLAGLLFAVAPVHSEAVSWVTGKVDLLPTTFYLATLWLFVRFRARSQRKDLALAGLVFVVGLFTKEILITLPVLLVAYDLLRPTWTDGFWPGRSLRRLAAVHTPFFAAAAGFLGLRGLVFDSFAREGRLGLPRLWHFVEQQPERLRALLLPVEPGAPGAALAAALTVGILAGAIAWLVRRRRDLAPTWGLLLFFGLAWYAVTMAPLIVTYVSSRHLYLPSCAAAVSVALVLFPVARPGAIPPSGRWRRAAALLLLALNGRLLALHNDDWVRAGTFSARARTQAAAAIASLPDDSVVLLSGFPGTERRRTVWKFALPFALQPPFVARDVYGPHRVLEWPDLYARPLAHWWRAKRPWLTELLDGDPDQRLTLHVLRWNPRRQRVVLRRSRHRRGFLRAQAIKAVGEPLTRLESIDAGQASRLVQGLIRAARARSQPLRSPNTGG